MALLQRLGKVHTVQVGHVDVEKHGVNFLLIDHFLCLDGALALGHELQIWDFLDVCHQLFQGQRFIIDCNTFNHSFSC